VRGRAADRRRLGDVRHARRLFHPRAGAVQDYFTGVHAALYVAGNGEPSYHVGVYGSGLCCATLVESGAAKFSWLAQSSAYAGTRQYAEQKLYNLIQTREARILGANGVILAIDPDATHPEREAGLFSVAFV
jgi:hypothetical protein